MLLDLLSIAIALVEGEFGLFHGGLGESGTIMTGCQTGNFQSIGDDFGDVICTAMNLAAWRLGSV